MRTGAAAADYARSRVGGRMPEAGYCLQFTRENYPVSALYASAIDAWHAAEYRHESSDAPEGVPVFYWSTSPYRHVAIDVGGGQVVSTYNDEIRLYTRSQMISTFGELLGWTEDLNGVRVWTPEPVPEPVPEPLPINRGAEMFVTSYGSSAYRLITGGHIVGVQEDTYRKLKDAGVPAVALKQEEVERLQKLLIFEEEPVKVKPV